MGLLAHSNLECVGLNCSQFVAMTEDALQIILAELHGGAIKDFLPQKAKVRYVRRLLNGNDRDGHSAGQNLHLHQVGQRGTSYRAHHALSRAADVGGRTHPRIFGG